MVPESVTSKLVFATVRLDGIRDLLVRGQLSAEPELRQQLAQELFFHAVGATEYLAQLVNDRRSLGLTPDKVVVHKVAASLAAVSPSDPLAKCLVGLSANTAKNPLPVDPYSDDGLIYRLINYRNEVAHRNANPFHFRMSAGPRRAYLSLDPRGSTLGTSTVSADADMANMLAVVERGCALAMSLF